MTIARMLIAVLLATHIGAAVGDQASRSSADCQGGAPAREHAAPSPARTDAACACIRLAQNRRVRCGGKAVQRVAARIRGSDAPERKSASGQLPAALVGGGHPRGAPTRRCMVTRGEWAPRLGSRRGYSPLLLCGVCASVPAVVVAAQSSCGHAPSLLCRPKATDIAARIGALDHKQAAVAIDGRCTQPISILEPPWAYSCDQSIIPLCAQRRWA